MRIGVLGISHKSAPLSLREKVAEACRHCLTTNKIVLSTCHRTEIYFCEDDLAQTQCSLFCDLKKHLVPAHEHAFYSFFGKECFFHLACVTAGLDSAIVAETDIQRQVKVAYEAARKKERLSAPLHYLFQKSLKLGKTVRSSHPLFQTTIHLEGVIYQLVETTLGHSAKLLFIGNSDINRKIIHYFWRKGCRNMTLVTAHLAAATPFALDYQLTLKDRGELQRWHKYDGIIAATPSDHYLITPQETKSRLIIDLSVPRSVDPQVGRSPNLTLLNMEEIGGFFQKQLSEQLDGIEHVKRHLEQAVDRYTTTYAIKSLQNRFDSRSRHEEQLC